MTGLRRRDAQGAEHQERADVVVSGAELHHTETALLVMLGCAAAWRSWRITICSSLFLAADWTQQSDAIFGPGGLRRPSWSIRRRPGPAAGSAQADQSCHDGIGAGCEVL